MPKLTDRSEDEAAIIALEESYDHAWNEGDIDKLVSHLSSDAVVVNPRGDVTLSRAEFKNIMSALLKGPFKGSLHSSKIIRIHFPVEGVAVVDGEAVIENVSEADESGVKLVRFTDVVVKLEEWLITDTRAYFHSD